MWLYHPSEPSWAGADQGDLHGGEEVEPPHALPVGSEGSRNQLRGTRRLLSMNRTSSRIARPAPPVPTARALGPRYTVRGDERTRPSNRSNRWWLHGWDTESVEEVQALEEQPAARTSFIQSVSRHRNKYRRGPNRDDTRITTRYEPQVEGAAVPAGSSDSVSPPLYALDSWLMETAPTAGISSHEPLQHGHAIASPTQSLGAAAVGVVIDTESLTRQLLCPPPAHNEASTVHQMQQYQPMRSSRDIWEENTRTAAVEDLAEEGENNGLGELKPTSAQGTKDHEDFVRKGTADALSETSTRVAARGAAASSKMTAAVASTTTSTSKTSRYLREMDRREILERLFRGEKQVTLAKEYKVSRAAICNLYKHRNDVMSRMDENPLAKHPKKKHRPQLCGSGGFSETTGSSGNSLNRALLASAVASASKSPSRRMIPLVHEVKTDAMQLLLTTMYDQTTIQSQFRLVSERALWLLLEEALSLVVTMEVQVQLTDDLGYEGVQIVHPPCAISMEQNASPMLDIFQMIEPDQPTGFVRFTNSPRIMVTLQGPQFPSSLVEYNVFILNVVGASGEGVCAAIQAAKAREASEAMIFVVALVLSSEVVAMVQCTFPLAKLVTTQIDSSITKRSQQRSSVGVVMNRLTAVYDTQ